VSWLFTGVLLTAAAAVFAISARLLVRLAKRS
jgi:hypothetical protein